AVAAGEERGRGAELARGGERADDVGRAPARREADRDVARTHEGAHLTLEHVVERVVVADAGEQRPVRAERLRRQRPPLALEAADELLGEVLRVGCAAPVPEREQAAAPLVRLDERRRELVGGGQ